MQATTKNKRPIGVFDSGVGGLSVLIELQKLLPNENFVFVADQKNVPYGEKGKKNLIKFAHKITDYFVKKHDIKLLVIACNTSTCYSLDSLREKYFFPIVGTVPAIKVAGKKTKSEMIAVISTPATSRSLVLKKFIKNYCKGVDVLNIACRGLENVVEKGEIDSIEAKKLLKKYLHNIKNSGVDFLVLACTHYPFLKKSIQKVVGSGVKLIDSGYALAKRTKSLLATPNLKNSQKSKGKVLYFSTGDPIKFSKVASKLLKRLVKAKKIKI